MGFIDKAKKMTEQVQQKLDEVQQQFNQKQAGGAQKPSAPVIEYDTHGRPLASTDQETPTQAATPEAAAPAPTPPPPAPAAPADAPDRSADAPPPMTSGDPLAG